MSRPSEWPVRNRGGVVRARVSIPVLFLAVVLAGCRKEIVPTPSLPSQAHAAYSFGLTQAGLGETALATDWLEAAARSVRSPQKIDLPLRESLFVDPGKPEAFGFRFATRRGQVIKIQVAGAGNPALRLFIDVFRPEEEKPEQPVLIASAGSQEQNIQFEPRGDYEYILRVQSELLRGGHFTLSILSRPAFDFPVQGRTSSSILSGFGASRDAGRRSHQGVDIFAPRNTPVLAPSRSYVRQVGENDLGGRVIWLRDEKRSLSLYFAHLQGQKVEEGQWVEAGDIIGLVGNSGNARTTPTHLHFGIYRRGAIDPYYYLHSIRGEAPAVEADQAALGRWVRSLGKALPIRRTPGKRAEVLYEVEPDTPLRVVGAAARYLKLRLPDGSIGYGLPELLALNPAPLAQLTLQEDSKLLSDPSDTAVPIGFLEAGSRVDLLGNFSDYRLVQQTGRIAWVHSSQENLATTVEERDND